MPTARPSLHWPGRAAGGPRDPAGGLPGNAAPADADLRLFLEARGPHEEDRHLEALAERLGPSMRAFLREKTVLYAAHPVGPESAASGAEAEVASQPVPRLFEELIAMKAALPPGTDLDASAPGAEAFAGSVLHRLLDEHLRAADPERRRLQARVVYVLRKPDHFGEPSSLALWTSGWCDPAAEKLSGLLRRPRPEALPRWERVAGPAEWEGRPARCTREMDLLLEDPEAFLRANPDLDLAAEPRPALFEALFRWLHTPLELDRLVTVVSWLEALSAPSPDVEEDAWTEEEPSGATGLDSAPPADPPRIQTLLRADGGRIGPRARGEQDVLLGRTLLSTPTRGYATAIEPGGPAGTLEEQRNPERLRRTWEALQAMPPHYRALLLLTDMEDSRSGAAALLESGAVTLRRMAAAMELPALRLAELWPSLPLDDSGFGELYEAPPARVEVWRFRARQRLR